ncbi:hypothetical protein R1A27_09845 [Methylobacterium sp. NMS12]|uniref:hypothetical protein n=1 Tax=Methylobacterium sp. NMS12 TaxID=3079766 RepID=UPI003F8825ED
MSDIVRASGINPRLQTAFKSHAAVDFARSGRALWARESVLAPTGCDLAGVGHRHSMFVDGAQPSAACRAASRVGDHRSAHTPQIAQATRPVRASVFRMAA